jgi:outer membrane protein assembly factor BamB
MSKISIFIRHRSPGVIAVGLLLVLSACTNPGQRDSARAETGHRVLTQGNGRLAIVEATGVLSWEMPWGGIHDIHQLPSGNIMVQQGASTVVEIDPETRQVVWSYDSSQSNGNSGKPVEVHAFEPLNDGTVMIAESGPARIIEVDRSGRLIVETPLKVDHPHPHTDTRLARKISADRYLVCHEGDGVVREYERGTGRVTWEFDVPLFGREPAGGHGPESFGDKCFCALRLANGNTLITTGNGHSVIEVTPAKSIVWKLEQQELQEITLGWVTTLEVLASGNVVIGNCHAGPGQPLLVEVDRESKQVVWTFDQFDVFGNSVPNSLILDASGSIR